MTQDRTCAIPEMQPTPPQAAPRRRAAARPATPDRARTPPARGRLPPAGPRAEEHRADRGRALLRRRRALRGPLEMPPSREGHHAGRDGRGRRSVGCLFLGRYFDQIMNEPIRQQQTLRGRSPTTSLCSRRSCRFRDEEIMTALHRCRLHSIRAHSRGHRPRWRLRGHQAARRRLPGRSGAHVRAGHRQALGRRRREASEGRLDAHGLAQGRRRHAPALRRFRLGHHREGRPGGHAGGGAGKCRGHRQRRGRLGQHLPGRRRVHGQRHLQLARVGHRAGRGLRHFGGPPEHRLLRRHPIHRPGLGSSREIVEGRRPIPRAAPLFASPRPARQPCPARCARALP